MENLDDSFVNAILPQIAPQFVRMDGNPDESLENLNLTLTILDNRNIIGHQHNENNASNISQNFRPDLEILKICQEWRIPNLNERFQKSGIFTINSLKFMTERDLDYLFHNGEMELKIMFRKMLLEWREMNGIPLGAKSLDYLSNCSGNCLNSVNNSFAQSEESRPSSTASSYVSDDENVFDLSTHLQTHEGRKIMQSCNNGVLTKTTREMLVQDIIRNYVTKNRFMLETDFVKIAKNIIDAFPKETMSWYYYKDSKSLPGGRIYWAYKNAVQKLRKANLFPLQKKRKTKNRTLEIDSFTSSENKNWLKYHQEPWDIIESKWKETFEERRLEFTTFSKKNICQLLLEWPQFTQKFGPNLVEIDFNFLYPQKENCILEKWDEFCKSIVPYFKNNVKDKQYLNYLKDLSSENITDEKRDLTIIKILHCLCPPVGVATLKKEKDLEKQRWKFSICDSIAYSILELSSFASFKNRLQEIEDKFRLYELTIQPMLMIIGNLTANNVEGIYVIYDKILYKYSSVKEALSSLIKIHYVFNLEYQTQAKSFWMFIQIYFFEIFENNTPTAVQNILEGLKR